MEYSVRHAVMGDLNRIEAIYTYARSFMAENGNPNQWGTTYPEHDMLIRDIDSQCLYVICREMEIHGVFYFKIGTDPTYLVIKEGQWRSETAYGTIHRIAGDGSGGILNAAVDFCGSIIGHLRIDTHHDNLVMQRAVVRCGFQRTGIIYVEDGTPRIAYDMLLK